MTSLEEAEETWKEIEGAIREHESNDLILKVTGAVYRDFYRIDMVFIDSIEEMPDESKVCHTRIVGRWWSGWSVDKDTQVEVVRDESVDGWVLEARP